MTADVYYQAGVLNDLDKLADEGKLHGLTIWKAQGGYQVSLQTKAGDGFRVMRKPTPSEGIAAVLSMDWMDDGHHEGSKPREPVDFNEAAIADLVEEAEAEIEEAPSKPGLFD